MGFLRKALFVATGGLSGLVFKDNSKKKRPAKAAGKQTPPRKQTKGTRAKPRTARRPTPRADRISAAARTAGPAGPTDELERLANLHGRGALTDVEFAAAKAKILGSSPTPKAPDRDPATFSAVEASVAATRHLDDIAVHDRRPSVTSFSSD